MLKTSMITHIRTPLGV